MTDRIEIKSSAPNGPTGPNDVALAKVGEELMARNGQAPPAEPPVEEQPEEAPLLAGKYKSVEELEKAYGELQKKLGSPEQSQQAAVEAVGEGEFLKMQEEYAQKGSLSEETFKSLEGRGIPRKMVEAYIEGQQALADRQTQTIYNEIGGEKEYRSLIEWAAKSLDPDEITVFNGEVQSGDLRRAKVAVKGLAARRMVEDRPVRRVEGRSAPADGDAFQSMAEVVRAMRDSRYATDPAYRKSVENKIARSGQLS